MLCKHEVVGSIPSGSTSLRWLCQLRLGEPDYSEGCHVEAQRAETDWSLRRPNLIVRENIVSHIASPHQDCGMRDF